MRELLVMRHAKSDWSAGETDFNRPLNARGALAAGVMADWLRDEGLVPDHIISSPAARTRATALAVMHACAVDRRSVDFDSNLYLADAYTWLQTISACGADRLLICGHNPGLDDLVDYLSATAVPLSASGKLMTTAHKNLIFVAPSNSWQLG